MIALEHVTKTYHLKKGALTALNDVDLRINQGEIFGIVGPSGAGKSTLVRCLAFLEQPDTGRMYLSGEDVTHLTPKALRQTRRRIGLVFQHFNLLNTVTVFDNVALPLRLNKTPQAQIAKRVMAALDLVQLADQADKYPPQLSGGQKQRIGIARALIHNPEVLLLDEATSALDPMATESILRLVERIWRETRITTILITHEMHVVRQLCHRVAVMHAGRLVEIDTVDNILLRPQHPITQDLVGHHQNLQIPAKRLQAHAALEPAQRQTHHILQLRMHGSQTWTPWLSECTAELDVTCAILRGTIDTIQDVPYAQLLIELRATPAALPIVMQRLRERAFDIEAM